MSLDVLYSSVAHASGGGRDGTVRSEDDRIDLVMRSPRELGGAGGGANPEQLLAAGYASSFLGAVHDAGNHLGRETADTQVSAEVGLAPNGSGGFELEVELFVHLPALEDPVRAEVVELARTLCPFANATAGNIGLRLTVVD